jgi:hypothetical protein
MLKEDLLLERLRSIRLMTMRRDPTATRTLGPKRSNIGPTWIPTKKTRNRYRLKIQPI